MTFRGLFSKLKSASRRFSVPITLTSYMSDALDSATKEIATNISHTSAGVTSANTSVAEMTNFIGKITNDITNVSKASKNISSLSGEIREKSGGLSHMATSVMALVGKFKI